MKSARTVTSEDAGHQFLRRSSARSCPNRTKLYQSNESTTVLEIGAYGWHQDGQAPVRVLFVRIEAGALDKHVGFEENAVPT